MTSSALSGLLPALFLAAALPASLRAAGGEAHAGLAEVGAMPEAGAQRAFVRFAAVGAVDSEAKAGKLVCDRVRSWRPGFVIALGSGGFPGQAPELFASPSQEGRWEARRGPVHVFSLAAGDSAAREGGAEWLRKALAASTAPWKIVCLSRAPFSSGGHRGLQGHGKAPAGLRWPFRQWGADAVIAGRDGHYERLEVDGIPYFVNALEGKAPAAERLPGSQCLFDEDLGAMLVEADAERMDFRFVTSEGLVVDAHSLRHAVMASGQLPTARHPAAVPASLRR